jgi:DNA-binding transcriptional MerR regulator
MAQSSPLALPPKLYFRIGEVAELVGVEPHVLRYWEREFRSIRPTKSAKGQRVYSRRDVENLMRVRELLYQEGFTIAGAKKKLHRAADADPRTGDVMDPRPGVAVESEPAPASDRTEAISAVQDAVPESGATTAPAARRERDELLAMRGEIEAFLAELDVARD